MLSVDCIHSIISCTPTEVRGELTVMDELSYSARSTSKSSVLKSEGYPETRFRQAKMHALRVDEIRNCLCAGFLVV